MRNELATPIIWTIVELFYRSHHNFQGIHDRYEKKVAEYVLRFGKPRQEIRLEPEELSGLLNFKELEDLRDSFLLPLKDACHALFRTNNTTDFLDRLVNDIFHEISILKEEHYNILTYESGKVGKQSFTELQTILDEVHEMFPAKVHRIDHLFGVARSRVERALPEYQENVVLMRSLFLHRDGFIGDAYENGLLRFYQILYGEDRIFEGFRRVGDSFYGAGFYKHAVESYAAGEKYLQGIPPQGKRRLHPSWKEAREHFKRTIRKARMHLEALEEQ